MTNAYTSHAEHSRVEKVFGNKQLLTQCQFARAVGVAPETVWRWANHGTRGVRLPVERLGGRVFVTRAGFDAWHRAINAEKSETVAVA